MTLTQGLLVFLVYGVALFIVGLGLIVYGRKPGGDVPQRPPLFPESPEHTAKYGFS